MCSSIGTHDRALSSAAHRQRHTHGTGCTLSAAIAARLALGDDLATAVARAKRYVTLRHRARARTRPRTRPARAGVPRVSDYTEGCRSTPFAVTARRALARAARRAVEDRRARATGRRVRGHTSFVGIVRATHKGRRVRYLEYEAFEAAGASRPSRGSLPRLAARGPAPSLAIHHRTGRLEIGEASVAIAAAAAHRAEAFQVCRYAIERVKQIAPVWKHEFFEDGDAWVEGPVADPRRRGDAARGAGARMRVTVQFFARLRELAGTPRVAARDAGRRDGRATSGARPSAAYGALAAMTGSVSAAVNAEFARMKHRRPGRRRGRLSAAGLRRRAR